MYTVLTTLPFATNYSQFVNVLMYLKKMFVILSEPRQCFSTRRLWVKQRSSLVNPTVVTKLQLIRIKTELAYIGADEERRHSMKTIVSKHKLQII